MLFGTKANPENISVTIDGIKHRGTYFVESKMVHVQSEFGSKVTQVGGSEPETIARSLFQSFGTTGMSNIPPSISACAFSLPSQAALSTASFMGSSSSAPKRRPM